MKGQEIKISSIKKKTVYRGNWNNFNLTADVSIAHATIQFSLLRHRITGYENAGQFVRILKRCSSRTCLLMQQLLKGFCGRH
jgi:hypothetical protein